MRGTRTKLHWRARGSRVCVCVITSIRRSPLLVVCSDAPAVYTRLCQQQSSVYLRILQKTKLTSFPQSRRTTSRRPPSWPGTSRDRRRAISLSALPQKVNRISRGSAGRGTSQLREAIAERRSTSQSAAAAMCVCSSATCVAKTAGAGREVTTFVG